MTLILPIDLTTVLVPLTPPGSRRYGSDLGPLQEAGLKLMWSAWSGAVFIAVFL